jgi:hypothetical protein
VKNGREVTREQALAWRENWSWDDRNLVKEHIDRLQARTFDVRPSGGVVRCYDASGRPVMYIGAGYIEFAPGCQAESIPQGAWRGFALSTNRPHGSTARSNDTTQYCPIHGYPVLPSGSCETCEEEHS